MFYKLTWDMERIDQAIEEKNNTIYAQKSNLENIEYSGVKTGFFSNIIYNKKGSKIENWPEVEFYYSSKASNLENEYLLNIVRWPIIHKKVMEVFNSNKISGIQYLPIKLIDVVTNKVNENYMVMNVLNFIEAYDMEKSDFTYNEKYDVYSFLPKGIILDENICKNYDVFRCSKDFVDMYISQKVKDIIDEHNWIGFEFYPQKTN
ncbi:MAG: imm11 family protein [Breznakia sp.]